ncbi:hypothetical protein Q9233_003830 [Columba guinea]|nr:hypothetical protein Q9233_003830 [Columba guinea]
MRRRGAVQRKVPCVFVTEVKEEPSAKRERQGQQNALGSAEVMKVAWVKLLLPGNERTVTIKMVIGDIPNSLLGMDILKGRQWEDSEGLL